MVKVCLVQCQYIYIQKLIVPAKLNDYNIIKKTEIVLHMPALLYKQLGGLMQGDR